MLFLFYWNSCCIIKNLVLFTLLCSLQRCFVCLEEKGTWYRCWFFYRFFFGCLLVLFKASVASWSSCTLSSFWWWEGENQDKDSFFPLPFGTVTGVCHLFDYNRLRKTGRPSGCQMLGEGANSEDESQVGVPPMVVIFSLCWGHFPLRESCLLMGYGPNSHWFFESGKSPTLPETRIRHPQGIPRV